MAVSIKLQESIVLFLDLIRSHLKPAHVVRNRRPTDRPDPTLSCMVRARAALSAGRANFAVPLPIFIYPSCRVSSPASRSVVRPLITTTFVSAYVLGTRERVRPFVRPSTADATVTAAMYVCGTAGQGYVYLRLRM